MVYDDVRAKLKEAFPQYSVTVGEDPHGRNIVTLFGDVDSWQAVIDVGHAAANVEGVKNVVSELTINGEKPPKKDYSGIVKKGREIGVVDECDVVVIGLGITGCGIARELSKYDLKVIAMDMGDDVATGATKANNGGVHMAGLVKPGTLKARLSVLGNRMYDKWAEELGFDFVRLGHMWYITDIKNIDGIYKIYKTAIANDDLTPEMLGREETLRIAPEIETKYHETPVASVWLPSQAKTHPYITCVALIENAIQNGVKVMLNCAVGDVLVENGRVAGVVTEKGIVRARYVINAAGLYGDDIAEMAGDKFFTMHNRRGTIAIIDKAKQPAFRGCVMRHNPELQVKKNVESKGGGTDQTPSGNILLGPSAVEIMDKEDVQTTPEDLDYVMWRCDNPDVTRGDIIRIFAGARPADLKEDFIVEESQLTKGFIIAGAIQSPGVGSSPAIAEVVQNILKKDLEEEGRPVSVRSDFDPIRKRKPRFSELSREEQDALIKENPAYGHIICRCEGITEGEIIDAIHSPLVPTSIDAIKQRTRAGMGRCQGGFCQPRVLEILARELGQDWVDVNLLGKGSPVLIKENR